MTHILRNKHLLISVILLMGILSSFSCRAQETEYRVVYIMSEKCPICQFYTLEMKELQKQYEEVDFLLVFSNSLSRRRSMKAFAKKYDLNIKMKRDHKLKIAKDLGAEITPEVFVLGKDDKLIYRGRIDNSYARVGVRRTVVTQRELRDVLTLITEGKVSSISNTQAVGCQISYLKRKQ